MKDDLNNAITRRRQREMKLVLARTGLGQHIRRALPTPQLSPATCQWQARDFRRETQERAKALLQAEEGAQLLFATWVPPAGLCANRPFRDGPQALLRKFEAGCRAAGVFAVAAAAEADFDVGEACWQGTAHGVLAASALPPPETVSRDLRESLKQQTSPRRRAIHQPLRIKVVTDLDGALRYTFKSLAILSAVQRSPWFDDAGKPRITKQKLRTPQLKQLLLQTIRHGLEDRVLLTKIEEIQS